MQEEEEVGEEEEKKYIYIVKNIRICIIFSVLLGQSEQDGCGEQGTYSKLKKKKIHK